MALGLLVLAPTSETKPTIPLSVEATASGALLGLSLARTVDYASLLFPHGHAWRATFERFGEGEVGPIFLRPNAIFGRVVEVRGWSFLPILDRKNRP